MNLKFLLQATIEKSAKIIGEKAGQKRKKKMPRPWSRG